MAYEQKNGQGSLFRNERRQNENAPHATGTIKAHRDIRAGETLRLAAWTKEGKNGRAKWQSLQMSDERERQNEPVDDSDAPF